MQLDLFEAEKKKKQGIKVASLNAEYHLGGWANEAIRILEGFLRVRTTPFLAEEFRVWCERYGLPNPPHKRAWGGVMLRACKMGLIEKAGYEKTTNPLAHRTPATLWRKSCNMST